MIRKAGEHAVRMLQYRTEIQIRRQDMVNARIKILGIAPYEGMRSLVYKGRKVALYGGAYAPSYLPNDVDTFTCGVNCGNHQIHHPPLIVKVHFFPCVQIAGNFFDLFRADGIHT